jgi:hypothetical protein
MLLHEEARPQEQGAGQERPAAAGVLRPEQEQEAGDAAQDDEMLGMGEHA